MTHDEKNAVSSEVVNEAGERYNEFHGWVDEEGLHFYAGRVDFAISPTRVPAKVEAGNTDTRRLGLHFAPFDYMP